MDRWLALLVLPTFFALMIFHRRRGGSWRLSFLLAACGWGTIVALSTEALSLVHGLQQWPLIALWTLASIGSIALCIRQRRVLPAEPSQRPGWFGGIAIFVMAVFIGFQWVLGYVAPPNNWDSMTYHLPRVMHWIQDRSVEPYPTNIPRQIHLGPFAEFCILHVQLLAHGDWFDSLVQWFGMVGCLVGVSVIAQRLGASRFGQIIAAVVCYTIPMGLLQATTTQNDYVLALWLVTTIALGLELLRPTRALPPFPWLVLPDPPGETLPPARWQKARWHVRRLTRVSSPMELCAFGAAIGLAVLTKGTSYFFLAPFVAVLAVWYVAVHRWRSIPAFALVACIALLLNTGQYGRNRHVSGSILGQSGEGDGMTYAVERVTLPGIVSNVMRNLALELTLPQLDPTNAEKYDRIANRLKDWNADLQSGTIAAHDWTDIRSIPALAKASDPAVSWGSESFKLTPEWANEDYASNPWHLALILAAIGSLWWARFPERSRGWTIARCLVIAGLLFCILLRWQPWHTRLHLPLFVVGSALVGLAADRIWNHKFVGIVAALLLASAVPYLLWHHDHPAIGPDNAFEMPRDRQYFRWVMPWYGYFKGSSDTIHDQHWKKIGFAMTGGLDWEYPIWVYLSDIKGLEIEHVELPPPGRWNATVSLAGKPRYRAFKPDAVILSDGQLEQPKPATAPTTRP